MTRKRLKTELRPLYHDRHVNFERARFVGENWWWGLARFAQPVHRVNPDEGLERDGHGDGGLPQGHGKGCLAASAVAGEGQLGHVRADFWWKDRCKAFRQPVRDFCRRCDVFRAVLASYYIQLSICHGLLRKSTSPKAVKLIPFV